MRQRESRRLAARQIVEQEDSLTVRRSDNCLRIDLSGSLSAIPSTNRRVIARGRLIRCPKAQAKLNAMTRLFINATASDPDSVRFGDEPIHVTLVCGERYSKIGSRIGRWDSHNLPKMLCDWLETVGIVNDDSRAEVTVVKRKDYFGDAQPITTIIIQPYEMVKPQLAALVNTFCENSALWPKMH